MTWFRLMWWEGGAWSDVESTQAKKRERIPETGMKSSIIYIDDL